MGNLAVTGVGLAWARSSGLDWRDLGLSREDAATGLAIGAGVAAAASALAVASSDSHGVEVLLDDDRLRDVTDREAWRRLLIRFPFGTALFEEVWFRGILPAILRDGDARRPELVANAAFAGWHLIPTAKAITANHRGRNLGDWRRAGLVVGGSVVAGLAGLGFSAMRQISSSLATPWLAHASFNGLTFLTALRHHRKADAHEPGHGGSPRRGGSR